MLFSHDSEEAQAYAQVSEGLHTAKLSHELIALPHRTSERYEHHLRVHGKPVSRAKAVELLAALTGGFVDRIAETTGLDALDRERA